MSDFGSNLQLEAGSKMFELIEFSLCGEECVEGESPLSARYGVNVAKVREVIRMPKINPFGKEIPGIEGVFELRGVPIPAVNLASLLGGGQQELKPEQRVIIAEFSLKRVGIIVDQTHRIRRMEWDRVMAASGGSSSNISGMILLEDNDFLFIVDLEKIVMDLETQMGVNSSPAESNEVRPQIGKGRTILFVDDSALIRNNISAELRKSGFELLVAEEGEMALGLLEECKKVKRPIDMIVTDIEMPKMDGLSLTKTVKQDDFYGSVPIVLHSSLSGGASMEAAEKVGADGYVVKNNMSDLLAMIGNHLKSAA